VVVALPAAASASRGPQSPLHEAARLSGLRLRHPVASATLTATQLSSRQRGRILSAVEGTAYSRLGLAAGGTTTRTASPRAWYDVGSHRLLVLRKPAAGRRTLIHEYVRALIDQNFGLKRLDALRARDRDAWTAATAIVDGTAALTSGLRASPPRGGAVDRFATLEANAGRGPGRALASELRYLGGHAALASALRTFPQTTEQLLHVDKFLERERALPVRLPATAGGTRLVASEAFGELNVRNLLQSFGVPGADSAAAGWAGGRLALYDDVAVVVLRWDSAADAAEWQAAVPRYVAAAFPGTVARTCPPLDACWGDVAAGVLGTTSVVASGPRAAEVAAALIAVV